MTTWEAQVQDQTFLSIRSFHSFFPPTEPMTKHTFVIKQYTKAVGLNDAALADTPAQVQELPFAQTA